MSRPTVLALALVLLTGAWHLATLRPGQGWGDDYALYIGHARNLVEGGDYAETGYIYNPSFPSLSPRTYPPVYPLLLAPVYRLFGLNLEAMKVELVLLFLLFLAAVYAGCRRELPPARALSTVLLLGASPFFWDFKDRVLSEIPFLLFTTLALLFLERAAEGTSPARRAIHALLGGVAVYLACGTRSVGVVLLPSVVLAEMFRSGVRNWRWPGLVTFIVLPVVVAGMVLQRIFLSLEGSYLDQLIWAPDQFLRNFVSFIKALSLFVDNGHSPALRLALYLPLLALAGLGYATRLRNGLGVREAFVPLYLAAICVWPSAEWGQRFLLPLLPLFLVYVWHGLLTLSALAPALARPAGVCLTVAVLAAYVGQYARQDFGPLPDGTHRPTTQAFFQHVRDQTPPDAVFLYQAPRALALYTGRRAAGHHPRATSAELWRDLRRIGATHVVVARQFRPSAAVLQPFIAEHPERFETVFCNHDFTVYRLARPQVAVTEVTR
jgi:4-amino-4-deoxy-L-arabinose transferase-like glycosyltransferase